MNNLSAVDPLVSVIIPVYNAERLLSETITSALNQTWPNIEIIVVDDGSTDNSLAVALAYQRDNLKVLTQNNQGASLARNLGLQNASGSYIQFLDADDLLSTNKIESQLKVLEGKPDHLGLCATVHFQDGENHLEGNIHHDWIREGSDDPIDFLTKLYGGDLLGPGYGGMIQPNSWLTPRHIIDKAGFWNKAKSPDDDGEFFCRVLLASGGVRYALDAINYYRKFAGGTWSAQKNYDSCLHILRGTDLKAQHLLKATNSRITLKALSRLYMEVAFICYPAYPDLSSEAERKALALSPGFKYLVYRGGVTYDLSKLIGWKAVRYLSHFKSKYIGNRTIKN